MHTFINTYTWPVVATCIIQSSLSYDNIIHIILHTYKKVTYNMWTIQDQFWNPICQCIDFTCKLAKPGRHLPRLRVVLNLAKPEETGFELFSTMKNTKRNLLLLYYLLLHVLLLYIFLIWKNTKRNMCKNTRNPYWTRI